MRCLITFEHSWVKHGVLAHSALSHLWKAYPQDIHDSLLNLLQRFGILYKVYSKQKEEPDVLV